MEKVDADTTLNEKSDQTKMVKDAVRKVLLYSFFAMVIYGSARFSWWIGLIWYLPFALSLLSRFVMTGFVFIIEVFVLRLFFRAIKTRGMNVSRLDELGDVTSGLVWMSVLLALGEIYLILVFLIVSGYLFLWYS